MLGRDSGEGAMSPQDLILAAAAGAVCLAICATLWALVSRRSAQARIAAMAARASSLSRAVRVR